MFARELLSHTRGNQEEAVSLISGGVSSQLALSGATGQNSLSA